MEHLKGFLVGASLFLCIIFLYAQEGFANEIGSPESEQGKYRFTSADGVLYKINTETGQIFTWSTTQPDILYNWYELK